jgi:hypothetical protein
MGVGINLTRRNASTWMRKAILAGGRLWNRWRQRREWKRTRKALKSVDKGISELGALGDDDGALDDLLDARWRLGRAVRQVGLERRLERVDGILEDLRAVGLTVRGWQVCASLQKVNFGFSSDLDIEVYIPEVEKAMAEEAVGRLVRHWWRDGHGQMVNVILRPGEQVILGGASRDGRDLVYGGATSCPKAPGATTSCPVFA